MGVGFRGRDLRVEGFEKGWGLGSFVYFVSTWIEEVGAFESVGHRVPKH